MRFFRLHPLRLLVVLTGVTALIVLGGFLALREAEEENPFADFRLEPATTSLVRVTDAGDMPDEALGVFFLGVETGQVDGWYDPKGETRVIAVSGDSRLVAFRRGTPSNPPTRNLTSALFLADRRTGAIFSWAGDAEPVLSSIAFQNNRLAAIDDRMLFRIENPEGDDWFALVDLDPEPTVVSRFQAPAYWGLLSADGKHAAVF